MDITILWTTFNRNESFWKLEYLRWSTDKLRFFVWPDYNASYE